MGMNNLAPIVLFVYKRPEHTKSVLEALAANILAKESNLYVFCDGPKDDIDEKSKHDIERTRQIVRDKQWCKTVNIIESPQNKGLTKSIKDGVSDIVNKYGKVIVLEDDIVISPFFLQFMNDALELYKDDPKVMDVSALVPLTTGAERLPETYFLRFMNCWGWATWARAWNQYISDLDYLCDAVKERADFGHFNFDGAQDFYSILDDTRKGLIDTWDLQWVATIFIKEGLCLYPKHSLSRNIGFDGTGEHCGNDKYLSQRHSGLKLNQSISVSRINIEESKIGYNYLRRYYKYGDNSSFKRRIVYFIKNLDNLKKLKFFQKPFFYKLYSVLKRR
ncbi:MAG: glycosyltransferase family 2 protein [Dysgonomonas sp.]